MAPPIVADTLPCGLLWFDGDGRVLAANPYVRRLLRLDAADPLPGTLDALLTPASRARHLSGVFERLRQGDGVEALYVHVRAKDHAEVPVLVSVAGADGSGPPFVAALMRTEDRGRLQEELLAVRRTAEQLPGLVYQYLRSADGSGSFPFASESIRDLLGISPSEARESAHKAALRVHRDDWPALERSIDESARTLARWEHQYRVVVGGKVRWIEGRATPQALPDGATLWHGYLCDISDRKALEASQQGQAVAEQANRAKSHLLARVSHELRTPLNAVLGFAQLLSHDEALRLRPHQQRQLAHIETAGRSLLGLINEVLDLTHIESGRLDVKIEDVEVARVVDEALAMVELMAGRSRVELGHRVASGLRVRADRNRLLQCLVNLLTNAIKYNREGGEVTLVAVPSGGREVRIDVRDTGQGFDADQLSHLFEPFNRLGAEHGGTEGSGLGLVITRALAERQGGRLTVDSAPGQGTCFSLFLARADWALTDGLKAVQVQPPPTLAAAPGGLAGRVLYVEDNAVNVVLMQAIFDLRPGLVLQVAGTAADGLAKALAEPPDLLLLDVGLPDMDGLTLLARMQEQPALRDVPAVAVSADALAPDIARAMEAGFKAYWTKPLDLRLALEGLDSLLAPKGA